MKLFFFVLCVFLGFCVQAEPFKVLYKARAAGMHLMDAELDVRENTNESYQLYSMSETRGLLSLFVGEKTLFTTIGKIKNNQFIPAHFSIHSKKRQRNVEFTGYDDVIDYQTALWRMLALKHPKTQSFTVDDGRRRMNLTFLYRGKEEIILNKEDVLCDVYEVTLRLISGKKGGWFFNRMGNDSNPPLTFYMGKDSETGRYLLLKGIFDTAFFGPITITKIQKEK